MGKQPLIYKCDDCGEIRPRDELVVKRVQFKKMGMDGKLLATRVVGWLCRVVGADGKSCLERDVHYGREPYVEAPGTTAKKLPEGEHAEG